MQLGDLDKGQSWVQQRCNGCRIGFGNWEAWGQLKVRIMWMAKSKDDVRHASHCSVQAPSLHSTILSPVYTGLSLMQSWGFGWRCIFITSKFLCIRPISALPFLAYLSFINIIYFQIINILTFFIWALRSLHLFDSLSCSEYCVYKLDLMWLFGTTPFKHVYDHVFT